METNEEVVGVEESEADSEEVVVVEEVESLSDQEGKKLLKRS